MKGLILLLLIPVFSIAQNQTSVILKDDLIDEDILKSELQNTNVNKSFIKTACAPTIRNIQEPLIIYNGEIVSREELKNIDINEIKEVIVLKGDEAISLYGSRASAGVIWVNGIDLTNYELIVSDIGYQSFLDRQASSGNYSLSYLEAKNRHYVNLWNNLVLTGNPEIFDSTIDYNPNVFYGHDFEYKLYQYFKFIESKYSISLN